MKEGSGSAEDENFELTAKFDCAFVDEHNNNNNNIKKCPVNTNESERTELSPSATLPTSTNRIFSSSSVYYDCIYEYL